MFTDSVQKSLEAKFSSGQAGAIPIIPSPEFTSRIAVSRVYMISVVTRPAEKDLGGQIVSTQKISFLIEYL